MLQLLLSLMLFLTLLRQRCLNVSCLLPAPAGKEVSPSVSQTSPALLYSFIYLLYPLPSAVLCLNPSPSCWLCGGERLLACFVSSCRVRKRTSGCVWNKTLLAPPPVGWKQGRKSISQSIIFKSIVADGRQEQQAGIFTH